MRFGGKDDDVDQAIKKERWTVSLIGAVVFFAVIDGISAFFSGESLASYGRNLAWLIGFGIVVRIVAPLYYEFRYRTKETDGKVSAIEDALIDAKDGHVELLERLAAIEDKLDAIQRELLSRGEATR